MATADAISSRNERDGPRNTVLQGDALAVLETLWPAEVTL